MSKNKITIGTSILAAVIVIVGATSISYAASRGGGNGFFKDKADKNPPAEMQAERTAMEQAFTNNDYTAWKTLMETRKSEMIKKIEDFSAKINEETFSKISEMRKLMSESKTEEANVIRQELGEIGFGFGGGFGPKIGKGINQHKGFVDANNNGICDSQEK